jgi:hypothetical protein
LAHRVHERQAFRAGCPAGRNACASTGRTWEKSLKDATSDRSSSC